MVDTTTTCYTDFDWVGLLTQLITFGANITLFLAIMIAAAWVSHKLFG